MGWKRILIQIPCTKRTIKHDAQNFSVFEIIKTGDISRILWKNRIQ